MDSWKKNKSFVEIGKIIATAFANAERLYEKNWSANQIKKRSLEDDRDSLALIISYLQSERNAKI